METLKICGRCKQEKPLSEFYVRRETGGYMSKCKKCNTECCKKYQDDYRKNRPAYIKMMTEKADRWRKRPENKGKYLSHCRKSTQKARDNLKDWYVRTVLTVHNDLNRSDIPANLVKAKKEHLKIQRELRSRK